MKVLRKDAREASVVMSPSACVKYPSAVQALSSRPAFRTMRSPVVRAEPHVRIRLHHALASRTFLSDIMQHREDQCPSARPMQTHQYMHGPLQGMHGRFDDTPFSSARSAPGRNGTKASAAMENRRAAKSNALMPPLSFTTTLCTQTASLVVSDIQDSFH